MTSGMDIYCAVGKRPVIERTGEHTALVLLRSAD
jgi:hypothetical protein